MQSNLKNWVKISEKTILKKFKNVIILTKQQKQTNDVVFFSIFRKTRYENLNFSDMNFLNTRVIWNLKNCDSELCSIIIKFNQFRYNINVNQIKKFAQQQNQKIYIFCAAHFRRFLFQIVDLNEFFAIQNKTDISFFDFFFYTRNMSCMFLTHVNTNIHHVNDVKNRLIDVYLNAENKSFFFAQLNQF